MGQRGHPAVADLELRLGTWIAWSRKTEDDAAMLGALDRLHDEYEGSSNNGTASGDSRARRRARGLSADGRLAVGFGSGRGRILWMDHH